MEQILELEGSDDITSIRSRIDFALPLPSEAAGVDDTGSLTRLLLIVPRGNKALQSLVNMKLLVRMTRTRPVRIAIVSDHPVVRDYAREAGVKAFATVNNARRAGWVAMQTPVASSEKTLPPVTADPEGQPPTQVPKGRRAGAKERGGKRKYVVVKGSGRIGLGQQAGALLLILLLGAALTAGFVFLLPEATITLTPMAEPVEANLVVTADPDVKSVDFQTLSFPARVAQVELAVFGEIETTETELAPVGLSAGEVTFVNRTEVEQVIPVTTTVATSAGEPVEFITTLTATLPAGLDSTATVPIVAVEPGPRGNVAAGQINRFANPSYAVRARVVNEQSLSGGSRESAKIVVQDDKERLAAYLRQKLQQEGYEQLQTSLGEQEFIPLEALQVIVLDISYREFAGDFSDTFGGEMQGVVRGVVVGGYNANRLALAALETQVPPGYELDVEGLHFGAGEVLDVQERTIRFRILASGVAVPIIDRHHVADRVAWLPIGEAQAMLSRQYNLAAVPGVELKPEWLVELLGRLPFSSFRIDVVINDAVTLVAEGE